VAGPTQIERLGALIRAHRQRHGLSIRQAAAQAQVPFNTLARVEKGRVPDLATFKQLVDWLGLSVEAFFDPPRQRPASTPEVIAAHLRADPALPAETAEHIAALVRDLYAALVPVRSVTALHLRAARTFEPEASALLATLLTDMKETLESE